MERESTPIAISAERLPEGFRHETGMQRVQRVPVTERGGRVHTSTVSVAILDENRTTTRLEDRDLARRWHSGTGAGGQHRNKTQNCLELTHVPTGISVSANGRSRKDNEREALRLLEIRLAEGERSSHRARMDDDRRAQAGSGSRSGERIRTWRFQEGMVIDHRTGRSVPVKTIRRKGIESIWPDKD